MATSNVIGLSEVRSGFRVDAEFYRAEFVAADHELEKLPLKALGHCAIVTDGEHGSAKLIESGIKYLTAENVKQGYVDVDRVRFVGTDVDKRNARARVREGDVLVSIKGTLGEIGLAEKELMPANMNRDVAIIKIHSYVNGGYLTAFLRSRFGAYQLAREGSGGVQQMITLGRLRTVQVVVLDPEQQYEIAELQKEGLQFRKASKNLYLQAEQFLETELGLDKLAFAKSDNYTANFSEVATSHRLDASHYRPRFAQLLAHIQSGQWDHLGAIAEKNLRGVQPIYVENGDKDVVNSQHIGKQHLDYDGFVKTTSAEFTSNPDAHIQYGDILIYSTGAYVGRTNVYLRETPALASNHVHILRVRSDINPAYLALVLSSPVGAFQTEKHARGSAQAELYPSDIAKFIVPLIDPDKQKVIGDLVRKSLEAQEESKRLLEQAKRRVEELIVEAIAE